jgi:hypothetical protein
MHYILKLPGTIAQVVNYPTTLGPFNSANEASIRVTQINKSEGYCGTTGVPLPERKEAA